jgi:hypothetical protein
MRRLVYFLLLVLVVGVSATGVSASTDCERWFAEYHSQLVHSQQVQRLAAAKRRAKRYAMRKLAGYVKPANPPVHVAHGPKMPRHEAMRKIELACGVLPEDSPAEPLIAEEVPADIVPELAPSDEAGLLPGFDGPGSLLPEESVPTPPVFSEAPPPAGGPPIYTPPFTTPVGNSTAPPPPPPPPPPVPEPSSVILLLTGLVGTGGVVRRRFKV